MSRPLIRSGQWSQTTNGISQPAARLSLENYAAKRPKQFRIGCFGPAWVQRDTPSVGLSFR